MTDNGRRALIARLPPYFACAVRSMCCSDPVNPPRQTPSDKFHASAVGYRSGRFTAVSLS